MLEVLDSAQASGQKSQQDAEIGQGSIFDLAGPADDGGRPALSAPAQPPIPTHEYERPELLRWRRSRSASSSPSTRSSACARRC
jgi:DNA polymerase-3 subunit alpha